MRKLLLALSVFAVIGCSESVDPNATLVPTDDYKRLEAVRMANGATFKEEINKTLYCTNWNAESSRDTTDNKIVATFTCELPTNLVETRRKGTLLWIHDNVKPLDDELAKKVVDESIISASVHFNYIFEGQNHEKVTPVMLIEIQYKGQKPKTYFTNTRKKSIFHDPYGREERIEFVQEQIDRLSK